MDTQGGLGCGLGQSMLRGCGYSGRPWLWAGAVHVEGVWILREALAVGWGGPC